MLNIRKLLCIVGFLGSLSSYKCISSDSQDELKQHLPKNQAQVLVIPGQNG